MFGWGRTNARIRRRLLQEANQTTQLVELEALDFTPGRDRLVVELPNRVSQIEAAAIRGELLSALKGDPFEPLLLDNGAHIKVLRWPRPWR